MSTAIDIEAGFWHSPPMSKPKPKLQAGVVYSADNGELICLHCAGASALYSGRDRSGHAVTAQSQADADNWKRVFGFDMTCEAGCTKHLATAGVEYSAAHAVEMFGFELPKAIGQ